METLIKSSDSHTPINNQLFSVDEHSKRGSYATTRLFLVKKRRCKVEKGKEEESRTRQKEKGISPNMAKMH
jgi:hypothetical protein